METAITNYIQTALNAYKVKFGVGYELDTFLKEKTSDFKTAFVSYGGFIVPEGYEDGGWDLRLHEFQIYLTNKYHVITDIETLIEYIKNNRQITATGLKMTVGGLSGKYVRTDGGFTVFEIILTTISGDKLA